MTAAETPRHSGGQSGPPFFSVIRDKIVASLAAEGAQKQNK